jgi:hypothetical protein
MGLKRLCVKLEEDRECVDGRRETHAEGPGAPTVRRNPEREEELNPRRKEGNDRDGKAAERDARNRHF